MLHLTSRIIKIEKNKDKRKKKKIKKKIILAQIVAHYIKIKVDIEDCIGKFSNR